MLPRPSLGSNTTILLYSAKKGFRSSATIEQTNPRTHEEDRVRGALVRLDKSRPDVQCCNLQNLKKVSVVSFV